MEITKRGRGRPRPIDVIDRDELIFQAVAGSARAVTKYEIESGTGIPAAKVYMSLRRLALTDRVKRVYVINKQHYWSDRDFPKPILLLQPVQSVEAPEQLALIPAAVFSSPE